MVFGNICPAGNGKASKDSGQTHLWLLTQPLPSSCPGLAQPGQAKSASALRGQAAAAPASRAAKPFGVVAPHGQIPCCQQKGPLSPAAAHQHHCCFPQIQLQVNSSSAHASQHPPPTLKAPMSCTQDTGSLFFLITCGYQ